MSHLHAVPNLPPPKPVAGRAPPQNLDAEAAVLSAIMLSPCLDRVVELLTVDDFYSDANGRIWTAALALWTAGQPVDIVTVAGWLRDREQLQRVGGPAYLALLSDATPAVSHVESHARVVAELARLRRMIATTQTIAAEGYGDVGGVQEWLDTCEQRVCELSRRTEANPLKPIQTVLAASVQRVVDAANAGRKIVGISTGFERLDALTSGFKPGQLVVLAGRPGMGKSALGHALALNVALGGHGVGVFSLEMADVEVGDRLLCCEGRIDLGRFCNGYMQPDDWTRMEEAGRVIASAPLWIDETSGIGLLELRAKVRRLRQECERAGKPLALVAIDYVQLVSAASLLGKYSNREQEISLISRTCKQIAKEERCTVLCLAQLNRLTEIRSHNDKRPRLSDIRESGSLEQDADLVLLMYRDDYYNPESDRRGIAEVIVAKQRNGRQGRALLRWTAECTRFDNLEPSEYPSEENDA